MEDYKKYIENVNTIRKLSKVVIEDSDDKQTIIDKIKKNAKESFRLKEWNDKFLDEFLYSKKIEDLSEEDIKSLDKFFLEIFDYSDSLDIGVSYKVCEKLLEYSKYINDERLYIKGLYYAGITLYYLDLKDMHNSCSTFNNKENDFFKKGASFIKNFKDYDSQTKSYIIRCLGNTKIGVDRSSKEGVNKYYEIWDKAMEVIASKEYRQIDPNINWDNFEYGMYMDQITILFYLRNNVDLKVANRVLEAAEYCYKKNLNVDNTKYLNWRLNYYYNSALYHAGKIDINKLVIEIKKMVDSAKEDDVSISGIYSNLTTKAYLLYYANRLDKENKEKIGEELKENMKQAYKYIDRLPGEYYRHTVASAIRELVNMQSDVSDNEKTNMMNYLVAFHKPTYVHSLMVAQLTKALAACVLMKCPENFIGVLDTKNKEDVLNKKDKFLDLAYNCGYYHDVGKTMCMSYININERKLIDEEFECIKKHAGFGYNLLIRNNENKNYALAALYHHRYYDGSAGYPSTEECPSFIKPIVDILSIADSIDAATDSIGRHYKNPKTLLDLIKEFEDQKGTRYAPFVVDLFKDNTVIQYIENIVNNERILVYLNVYHKGKSYTISSYIKS